MQTNGALDLCALKRSSMEPTSDQFDNQDGVVLLKKEKKKEAALAPF